jgi:hypothetical protein
MKLVVGILVLAVACGGGAAKPAAPIANAKPGSAAPVEEPAPKPRSDMEEAFAKYESWTKQMCACPAGDTACAQRITDDQIKWAEEWAKRPGHNRKIDPKESELAAERMKPIMEEYTKCAMKAMTPSPTQPTTP